MCSCCCVPMCLAFPVHVIDRHLMRPAHYRHAGAVPKACDIGFLFHGCCCYRRASLIPAAVLQSLVALFCNRCQHIALGRLLRRYCRVSPCAMVECHVVWL